MSRDKLRICTWNIKGVHNNVKRRKILAFLNRDHIDIALLQETHLNDEEHLKLCQYGYAKVFFSSFTSRSRGVAILVKKTYNFQYLIVLKTKVEDMLL